MRCSIRNTNHTVNGIVERTPFPNNIIPISRMDPTAAIIQNMIPLPNTPGVFNYTAPAIRISATPRFLP